jgi:hypothetical protein
MQGRMLQKECVCASDNLKESPDLCAAEIHIYNRKLLSIAQHCSALISKHAFKAWLLTMISKYDVVGGGKLAKWQLEFRGKISTWLLFNTTCSCFLGRVTVSSDLMNLSGCVIYFGVHGFKSACLWMAVDVRFDGRKSPGSGFSCSLLEALRRPSLASLCALTILRL